MDSHHVLRSRLHEGIYEYLIQVARRGDTTTYSDVARLVQLDMGDEEDRDRLSQILGMISTYEHQQERPMLSAVVVHV